MQLSRVRQLVCREIILCFFVIPVCHQIHSQVKWDGGGGDGLWSNPANWIGNTVPSSTDNVILDHSAISGNYIVILPGGLSSTTVKSLIISPAVSRTIEVVLPVTSAAIPGFTAVGSGYGLEIHRGGIFRNSSGAATGSPVEISDSIIVYNGGLYIHNTSRAHASNVMVLSRAPGTEDGSFEFDVPGGSGYTVSIAGRVYGNLILSAVAAGGTKSYTSTGATTLDIVGEFRINAGVNYSLNFSGIFIIHGDFNHKGNVFDISSGLHNNQIRLRKNLFQSGIITESGTGLPVIVFEGSNAQNITLAGSIAQNITLQINNASGVNLLSSLSIFYKIDLISGNIRTTPVHILVIHDNATCSGGSINSFVEGPLRKIGDDDFNFPIGKQGNYAPVSIAGPGGIPSDAFEAEYMLGNAVAIFGNALETPPIIRISTLEYWKTERLSGISSKKLSLSVRTYSNATLLEKLVVSRWDISNNTWKNQSNTAFAGISTGTITSDEIHSFGIFTIASTVGEQNPLPLTPIVFDADNSNEYVFLKWQIDPGMEASYFEVLRSNDNARFAAIHRINIIDRKVAYNYAETLLQPAIYYYKVKIVEKNGGTVYSSTRVVSYKQNKVFMTVLSPLIRNDNIQLTISVSERTSLTLLMINTEGKIVRKRLAVVDSNSNQFLWDIQGLASGVYVVVGVGNGIKTNVIRVIKY